MCRRRRRHRCRMIASTCDNHVHTGVIGNGARSASVVALALTAVVVVVVVLANLGPLSVYLAACRGSRQLWHFTLWNVDRRCENRRRRLS
jgi:hypothetical protein